jgi:molybdenum cofactor synthesis domain-containing protein
MAQEPHETGRTDIGNYLKLMTYAEVRTKIEQALSGVRLATERVHVDDALGRVSAEGVSSPCDIPAAASSMMDGYAIRSDVTIKADDSNPASFKVRGALSPSSARPTSELGEFDACYVATGAPIPPGADAVVKVEESRLSGSNVAVSFHLPKWKNVALQGEDVHVGDLLVGRAQILNAADIALLIAAGRTDVEVFRRPRVGILSTGDELTHIGSGEQGKKVNNYANLIAGYLSEAGTIPVFLGVAKDDQAHITGVVEKQLARLDALVTIGGTSMGVKDFTPGALMGLAECRELFHGIRLVPVKPTGVFMIGKKPVILLPGHAVSAALSFFLVVRPITNILSGLKFTSRVPAVRARISEELTNPRPLGVLLLVRVTARDEEFTAIPLPWGSNLVSSLARANGYVQVEPHTSLEKGERVTVSLLGANELLRVMEGERQ